MRPAGPAEERILFGRLLFFFAGYTVLIKYILPVSYALWRGEPPARYIFFWDAWWAAHLAVGYGLVRGKKIWAWAFLLSAAELIIISMKFVLYARSPNLDFWHLNWLVNKTLLLVYFGALMRWLLTPQVRRIL